MPERRSGEIRLLLRPVVTTVTFRMRLLSNLKEAVYVFLFFYLERGRFQVAVYSGPARMYSQTGLSGTERRYPNHRQN
jgi:hypothetical protein